MAYVFRKATGELLLVDFGEPDIEQTAVNMKFEDGWTCHNEPDSEARKLLEPYMDPPLTGRLPDSPSEKMAKLAARHDALIEVLEDHLKLNKGDLKAMIAAKLEGK